MMEKERSGLFCRRIRYDGAWETVYFLESGGGLWLPEPLLRARGLFPGKGRRGVASRRPRLRTVCGPLPPEAPQPTYGFTSL